MILEWAVPAVNDLKAIRSYIVRDSEPYAAEFTQKILLSVEKIREFPKIGRVVPELQNDVYRELLYHQYRIIYRLLSEKIQILTILHGSRDLMLKKPPVWEII